MHGVAQGPGVGDDGAFVARDPFWAVLILLGDQPDGSDVSAEGLWIWSPWLPHYLTAASFALLLVTVGFVAAIRRALDGVRGAKGTAFFLECAAGRGRPLRAAYPRSASDARRAFQTSASCWRASSRTSRGAAA